MMINKIVANLVCCVIPSKKIRHKIRKCLLKDYNNICNNVCNNICNNICDKLNTYKNVYNSSRYILPPSKNGFIDYWQVKEIHKVLDIKDCVGYDFIRVGKDNDGGYLMINDFNNSNIAYSFGICDDVSWDESIIDIAKKKKKKQKRRKL